jgi:predicted transcriptional regulator with HTH domain
MENSTPFSDLHQKYIAGTLPKKNLEGMIFQHLLENFERFRLFKGNRERWNDFLSWLYPRLARAIDIYRNIGSSFDAYITGLVNSAAREYRCREADHSTTEYVCWRARAEEMMLTESEPEYFEGREEVSIPDDINRRQILFLLLKSYFFVSDEFVTRVSRTIGMNAKNVQNMIDELRKRRSEKEAEILDLRERLHCQHYRCLAYQKRMINAQPGTNFHEKMKDRLERARKRYTAMKKRLGGMRVSASNKMIADVLGIPHGTVDSSLFAVKNRFALDAQDNKNSGAGDKRQTPAE